MPFIILRHTFPFHRRQCVRAATPGTSVVFGAQEATCYAYTRRPYSLIEQSMDRRSRNCSVLTNNLNRLILLPNHTTSFCAYKSIHLSHLPMSVKSRTTNVSSVEFPLCQQKSKVLYRRVYIQHQRSSD